MTEKYAQKIFSFFKTHKRMPSYSDMQKLFSVASKNSVYRIVQKLVDARIIAKDAQGRIVPHDRFYDVKILGTVKAGFPSPAEEELQDTISFDEYLIEKKEASYILEVDGDSMIDAHITKGDLVVVERTQKVKDGEIVVAEIDGEYTMKYFRKQGEKVWLEAGNSAYGPMHPTDSLKIVAVVRAVVRKF